MPQRVHLGWLLGAPSACYLWVSPRRMGRIVSNAGLTVPAAWMYIDPDVAERTTAIREFWRIEVEDNCTYLTAYQLLFPPSVHRPNAKALAARQSQHPVHSLAAIYIVRETASLKL
ncbi:hypothetical protein BOTBODRAFT_34285 [Botryobasidium botryosum FD-172 SS1]|uniref:Uncharacterized protein n=1 Tax=Botryobasidium botryosum (strain FD-172 SS1) TaxID=930990 RepID=A0A067MCW2_BOTB1|nr:hypothetical protein BOTBODRAFT_34285 [Botryobasidium botryosum FD-172 SS1]